MIDFYPGKQRNIQFIPSIRDVKIELLIVLHKANIRGSFPKALTAHINLVFSDNSRGVVTNSASTST